MFDPGPPDLVFTVMDHTAELSVNSLIDVHIEWKQKTEVFQTAAQRNLYVINSYFLTFT